MKRIATIKKQLEAKGYTVIEREDTLVLAQELQRDTLKFKDGDLEFDYPPTVHVSDCEFLANDEVETIAGDGWFWECEYGSTFKLYKA